MQIVSTAWIDASPEEFELNVGLGLHAEHGRASAAAPLRVFVLHGFGSVPPNYRRHLADGHVELIDAGALAQAWMARLPGIVQRLNRYEALCFLRWPVLRDALAGAPFLHIDLDLFLQPDFAATAAALDGRTFALGSPCFLAASDRDWLGTWCAAIEEFDRDPEGCQARLDYKGTPARAHIGSDQDLLGALNAARVTSFGAMGPLRASHAAFVNPLYPSFAGATRPMRAERTGGIDLFDGRPVLFWHMQNDFARYAGRHLMLVRQLRGQGVPRIRNELPHLPPSAEGVAFSLLRTLAIQRFRNQIASRVLDMDKILHLAARGPLDCLVRGVATRHFVLRGEGRELFSADLWWEAGVFA